jgi:hypothetical protein
MISDRRRSWEIVRESARRELDAVEICLERSPWWVTEGEELPRERSRLIHILQECDSYLGRNNANYCQVE